MQAAAEFWRLKYVRAQEELDNLNEEFNDYQVRLRFLVVSLETRFV